MIFRRWLPSHCESGCALRLKRLTLSKPIGGKCGKRLREGLLERRLGTFLIFNCLEATVDSHNHTNPPFQPFSGLGTKRVILAIYCKIKNML